MNGSVVPGSDEWLDAEQVAEILVISRRTLWNYASLGRLPADGSFGRSPAWKRSTIDRYLEGMPERGRSARANRAARLAARVHAEVPDGSRCPLRRLWRADRVPGRPAPGHGHGRVSGHYRGQHGPGNGQHETAPRAEAPGAVGRHGRSAARALGDQRSRRVDRHAAASLCAGAPARA
jgi:predicted DNA-binding transcriptional regulator AlpA